MREKMRRDWTTDNGGALNTFWAGAMVRRVAGSKGGGVLYGARNGPGMENKREENRIHGGG